MKHSTEELSASIWSDSFLNDVNKPTLYVCRELLSKLFEIPGGVKRIKLHISRKPIKEGQKMILGEQQDCMWLKALDADITGLITPLQTRYFKRYVSKAKRITIYVQVEIIKQENYETRMDQRTVDS